MNYSCILASDDLGGIGNKGKIPWKCLEDFKFFSINTKNTSKKTKFNAVIMGRKTFESLPCGLLKNRLNIVLTRTFPSNLGYLENSYECNQTKQAWYCDDFNLILKKLKDMGWIDKVFIIGGSTLYNTAFIDPRCKSVYYTNINGSYECDTFVDLDLLKSNFNKIFHTPFAKSNDVKYSFQYWIKPS